MTKVKKVRRNAPTKTFSLKDGRTLKNIYDLVDELEIMSEDVFKEYVNDGKNHFANWIDYAFDQKTLAKEMRLITDRLSTQRVILKHLVRKTDKGSLHDVPNEQLFWLKNGTSIRNLAELARELHRIDKEVFTHLVNDKHNDFVAWIKQSLNDTRLATLISTTKNQERMVAIVERRIKELTQPTIVRKAPATKRRVKAPVQHITVKRPINRTKKVTHGMISHPIHRVVSENRTHLRLLHNKPRREIYVHEVKQQQHGMLLLLSHLVLGIVVGVAVALMFLL